MQICTRAAPHQTACVATAHNIHKPSIHDSESIPAMYSSNLSTRPGFVLWGLARGEISTGKSNTKVGCCKVDSTAVSKHSARIWPLLAADCMLRKLALLEPSWSAVCCSRALVAAAWASSRLWKEAKSKPAAKRERDLHNGCGCMHLCWTRRKAHNGGRRRLSLMLLCAALAERRREQSKEVHTLCI